LLSLWEEAVKRHSKEGRGPAKARRRKTVTRKRSNAPKAGTRHASAHQKELARVTRERDELLEQQTATSEVLKVISSSTFELQTVLETLCASAARLCETEMVAITRLLGGKHFQVANFGYPPGFSAYTKTLPLPKGRGSLTGRVLLEKDAVHIPDVLADPEYAMHEAREMGGFRTMLGVPLLREGNPIGVIILLRRTMQPFTARQIELVKTFADQAVIAIENVRLFEAEQQRARELTESLQQQTATADVLRIISSSPGELEPVFQAILENSTRICQAHFGTLNLYDGNAFRNVALHNPPPQFAARRFGEVIRPHPESGLAQLARTREIVHIGDIRTGQPYLKGDGAVVALADLAGARTVLIVPMLNEGRLVGAIAIYRQEIRLFADKQIDLVKNFAAQAVIAVENARLLNELRRRTDDLTQRTAELTESLEQQTATSEVLQVISRSPGDLEPVFATMLENAARICDANFGNIFRWDGDALHLVATHNTPPAFVEARKSLPLRPNKDNPIGRMLGTKTVIHVANLAADERYTDRRDRDVIAAVELGGIRTFVAVPMLKENNLIGALIVYRQEVRPFTDKQIALVTNFANQAVIAIENTRLLNELREALQQQTATADVLKVISRSTFDLQYVLDTLAQSAAQLCEADTATIHRPMDGAYVFVASYGYSDEYPQYLRNHPIIPGPGSVVGRTVLDGKTTHVFDVQADSEYALIEQRDIGKYRTVLGVPLMREGAPVGVIVLTRNTVRPFSEKQIELVETFADQAVIAIENVRLFEAEQQRTQELTESLEQQTATSEVLQVISAAPGQLEPVFATMLEKAVRICDAKFGTLFRVEGDMLRLVATRDVSPAFAEAQGKEPFHPAPGGFADTVMKTGRTVHLPDLSATRAYVERHPRMVEAVEIAGIRTVVGVPMLKDNELIGIIGIYRQEVRPFTDKQIELLTNFAAQAVIAIENTRLLNELRESLQQQTATADVLKVISRSTFDLQTVLDALVESAARLCEADTASINREKGEAYHMVASYGLSPEVKAYMATHEIAAGHGSIVGRTIIEGKVVQITDVQADLDYKMGEVAALAGIHTMLGVPLLRSGIPIGVINFQREAIRPFTEKQIELAETFADQAVIAIENVRLLDELRHRTDELSRSVNELRALGEVSQTVNSTLDLDTVLSTIVSNAVQLSGTEAGAIYVFDNARREFNLRATYGMDQTLIEALTQQHIGMQEPNVEMVLAEREPVQVADVKELPPSDINEITLRAGFRARLVAPLLRGEDVVGLLVVRRRTPGAFPQSTIDLIKTFAAQSAVAIENARLFQDVQASLDDLRTAQDRLIQTEKLASLGQLTAGIAHEIKNPLNFVNNFSGISVELVDELQDALARVKGDDKMRSDIAELAHTLQDNLNKIVQHGKRADSIVKNMLLHSRAGSGERRPVDINGIVDEAVNLAYHGARAERQGFNITLERSFDPAAGQVDCFPQEITRVLLNLISNGFYAATTRKGQTEDGGYEPTLTAATRNLGDRVEIRIRDNGSGIPPEVREKMFNPFFTTKPAGEGTGLGLSISHDIVVKQHAGRIEVDSQPGEFTEFRIVLPRAAVSLGQTGGRA
jgi:two-component system, NtrC family, sensor kinase